MQVLRSPSFDFGPSFSRSYISQILTENDGPNCSDGNAGPVQTRQKNLHMINRKDVFLAEFEDSWFTAAKFLAEIKIA